MKPTPITVAYGDGIGPEIMEATLEILRAAKAQLEIETIEVGKAVYEKGFTSGISPDAWKSLKRTKTFLKAPITTPQGGGFKSLNVTIRKTLGLYSNVRPCMSYFPFVSQGHPTLDMVIIRENEEDLYTGIEHRQTQDMVQCLKLISRSASERIVRYAFEYAVKNGRKRLSCFSKDNIMKMADGLFHQVFNEIAKEYPTIKTDHYIIDIGTARIASKPQLFDMIVTTNLYGDIISDVAAEISGSVGLAGSANVGDEYAMFEAIHGSAPDIAGKDIANPSGLLNGAVMMLVHLGQCDPAALIHNALLTVIEEGYHTADIFSHGMSKMKLGTKDFTKAVIDHLGQQPDRLKPVSYAACAVPSAKKAKPKAGTFHKAEIKKELVGVDVFVDWWEKIEPLAAKIKPLAGDLELKMITAKGLKVWPDAELEAISRTDHWRCCFMNKTEGKPITHAQIVALLGRLDAAGIDAIKTENLYTFDGKAGYSLAQGE